MLKYLKLFGLFALIAIFFLFASTAPGIQEVRVFNPEHAGFIKIANLDLNYYNRINNTNLDLSVMDGWQFYLVTGEEAKTIEAACNCYGMTIPVIKVGYVLVQDEMDWRLVMAHEFVHIMQAADGNKMEKIPSPFIEGEAYSISETAYPIFKGFVSADWREYTRAATSGEVAILNHVLNLLHYEIEEGN